MELAAAAGLLLIPVTLAVLSVGPWLNRQLAARVASREAARVVVLAQTFEEGEGAAQEVVAEIARNHGLASGDLSLRLDGSLTRGGTVTAEVSVRVPILAVPGLGDVAGPWAWTARHTEAVDLYRSLP